MVDLTTNCISYYKLDNAAVLTDEVGRADATNDGADATTTAKLGSALLFVSANSDNAYIPYTTTNLNNDWSWSLWVNMTAVATTNQMIMGLYDTGTNDRARLQLNSAATGFLMNWFTDNDALQNSAVVAGKWYHIVVTHSSGGVINLYVDNVLVGTDTTAATFQAGTKDFIYLGKNEGINYLGGIIDEVAIFDKVLTTEEIARLWNGGSGLPFYGFDGVSSENHVVVGTGTKGTRYVDRNYPYTEGLTAGTTKQDNEPNL